MIGETLALAVIDIPGASPVVLPPNEWDAGLDGARIGANAIVTAAPGARVIELVERLDSAGFLIEMPRAFPREAQWWDGRGRYSFTGDAGDAVAFAMRGDAERLVPWIEVETGMSLRVVPFTRPVSGSIENTRARLFQLFAMRGGWIDPAAFAIDVLEAGLRLEVRP